MHLITTSVVVHYYRGLKRRRDSPSNSDAPWSVNFYSQVLFKRQRGGNAPNARIVSRYRNTEEFFRLMRDAHANVFRILLQILRSNIFQPLDELASLCLRNVYRSEPFLLPAKRKADSISKH